MVIVEEGNSILVELIKMINQCLKISENTETIKYIDVLKRKYTDEDSGINI